MDKEAESRVGDLEDEIIMETLLLDAFISTLIKNDDVASMSHSLLEANSGVDVCEKMLKIWDSLKQSTLNVLALAAKVSNLQKHKKMLWNNLLKAEGEVALLFNENQKLDEECTRLTNLLNNEGMHGSIKMKSLPLRMESSEETVRTRDEELKELSIDKENVELINEKGEQKEKENADLIDSNKKFAKHLEEMMQQNQNLKSIVKKLLSHSFWDKVIYTLISSCFELVQEEKKLATQKAQQGFDCLHGQLLTTTSGNDALQLVNQELNNKIIELQNDLKVTISQHAEECQLAEEKVQRLESEAEMLLSKKAEMDNLITTLEDKIRSLSEASRLSEIQMQDLQLKHSESETENKENIRNLELEIHRTKEETDTLKKEILQHEQHVDSLEKQLDELHSLLQEKEQVILEVNESEKLLEDLKSEARKLFVEAEGHVAESKKQYDEMLRSKQLELSKHLKEISEKTDQAINDIRRRYEAEKQELLISHFIQKTKLLKNQHEAELRELRSRLEEELNIHKDE